MMFKDNENVGGMQTFQLLSRLFSKECEVETTLDPQDRVPTVNVKVIGPKKASSKSLLNPWDPDATYSGHKGQGYHVQLMEAYALKEDGGEGSDLRLITLRAHRGGRRP
jgi:hypothetical protein